MKEKILRFLKRETVLCAAFALAVLSAFLVPPDGEYISYIDFRTLALLFCLMGAMSGLRETGVFSRMAQFLLSKVKKTRQLVWILVALCFFSSMIVTNDVALITFVPFTFAVLRLAGEKTAKRLLVPVVALQTVAANLGSMLTPIGNPQNLYLYGKAGITLGSFLLITLPYTALSFVIVMLMSTLPTVKNNVGIEVKLDGEIRLADKKVRIMAYILLFALDLLAVARIIPCAAALAVTVIVLLLADRRIFLRIDYSLLLTFAAFFVFVGNMGRLPAFNDFLQRVVSGRELLCGAAASQIISNVPAALLLSGFTDNIPPLIIGVNIGGLGTLIASMASLISYKLIVREDGKIKVKYFAYFTLVNIVCLAALLLFALAVR